MSKRTQLCLLKYGFIFFLLPIPIAFADCTAISHQQVASALHAVSLAKFMTIEAADCASIEVHQDSVTFNLNENTQKIHGGVRAEVAVDYPFKEEDEVSYTFDVKLARDFKGDSPKNRWWLIAQWHDQPDPNLNEHWDTFPKRSPPVSLYVEDQDGVVGLGVEVLANHEKYWLPFPLGEWLTFTINIHWSTQDNGFVDVNVANHPEWHYKIAGKNMHNAYQHYLKLGQYRHPDINIPSQIYFRNLMISR